MDDRFGFEGGNWDLIVLIPDNCLIFTSLGSWFYRKFCLWFLSALTHNGVLLAFFVSGEFSI